MTTNLIAFRRRRRNRLTIITALLAALLTSLFFFALIVGETWYSFGEVMAVIAGDTVPGASFSVGEIRLPRASLAIVAGAAFGVSGITFQTMLRNQLASPDIIGISSGASAAGVVAVVFFHYSQTATSIASLVASLAVAGVVYLLSLHGGFTGTRLILIGIGVAAMLNAVVTYSLSRAAAWDLPTATRWLSGSLNSATWERAVPTSVVVLVLVPLMVLLSHQLNLLRLGDELATGLGVRVPRVRITAIITAVALIAVATAACGPIAFVAFMAGPITMRIVGPSAPLILPTALVGALLTLTADLLGQYLFGTRYPVGVITGALGAPYLIFLLIRTSR